MKNVLQENGSATIVALLVATVLGGGIVAYMQSMKTIQSGVKTLSNVEESNLASDKLKTLANYLISTNMVICKQGPFMNESEGYKCKWSGKQLIDGSLANVPQSKLGLERESYDKDGFLTFNVNTSKLKSNAKAEAATPIKGTIAFKLYDAQSDKLNLSGKLGKIALSNLMSDNDRAFVLIKVEAMFKEGIGKDSKTKTLTEFFSTRRPTAVPKLDIDPINCVLSCEVSVSRNEHPGCLGDQNFNNAKETKVNAVLKNLGPGVLYGLKLEKEILVNKKVFENMVPPKLDPIEVMQGKDYLLPGESVEWTDTVPCFDRKDEVRRVVTYDQNGVVRGIDCFKKDNGQSIVCPDDSGEQRSVNAGTINYKVDVSPYKHSQYQTLEAEIRKKFSDDNIPFNWAVPDAYKSSSRSTMEPARTLTKLSVSGDINSKEVNEMSTEVQVIQVSPN